MLKSFYKKIDNSLIKLTAKNLLTGSTNMLISSFCSAVIGSGNGKTCDDSMSPRNMFAIKLIFGRSSFSDAAYFCGLVDKHL